MAMNPAIMNSVPAGFAPPSVGIRMFVCDELLGLRLLSLHNVHFLIELTSAARAAILRGDFEDWADEWLARYRGQTEESDEASPLGEL